MAKFVNRYAGWYPDGTVQVLHDGNVAKWAVEFTRDSLPGASIIIVLMPHQPVYWQCQVAGSAVFNDGHGWQQQVRFALEPARQGKLEDAAAEAVTYAGDLADNGHDPADVGAVLESVSPRLISLITGWDGQPFEWED